LEEGVLMLRLAEVFEPPRAPSSEHHSFSPLPPSAPFSLHHLQLISIIELKGTGGSVSRRSLREPEVQALPSP
jgi:hypothetical protein